MTTLADVRKAFEDNPLPEKLSDCILLALEDLERVEKDARYTVDMDTWHKANGVCRVCLAGAVISGLVNDPCISVSPIDVLGPSSSQLCALDAVRLGFVRGAVTQYTNQAWSEVRHIPGFVPVKKYSLYDPDAFKTDLRNIAAMLREAGE